MDIQWYPGHMTRARRQMQEDLKLVDLIIELIDARVPLSGRNPRYPEHGAGQGKDHCPQ
jgi:ribosome biogenesis GTPase A